MPSGPSGSPNRIHERREALTQKWYARLAAESKHEDTQRMCQDAREAVADEEESRARAHVPMPSRARNSIVRLHLESSGRRRRGLQMNAEPSCRLSLLLHVRASHAVMKRMPRAHSCTSACGMPSRIPITGGGISRRQKCSTSS